MPLGKKYGGRVKGTPNKATQPVLDILNAKGFNVVEELVELYHRTANENSTAGTAAKCLSELASYVYPKRKHIEITEENPYLNMSKKEIIAELEEALNSLKARGPRKSQPIDGSSP